MAPIFNQENNSITYSLRGLKKSFDWALVLDNDTMTLIVPD